MTTLSPSVHILSSRRLLRIVVVFGITLLSVCETQAQQHDTAYYSSYVNQITGRFYFSKKYTLLRFRNFTEGYSFSYRPNTTLNMGVGATYRWATLNLAYGFGFLNPDTGKGKTKYLDLQFHSYGRKILTDVFGQFYKGFYLAGSDIDAGDNYLRPDLRVNMIGASSQYIFNHERFSYRAAFLQNEYQKKSAGTVIAGIEAYYGIVRADSSIVPSSLDKPVATGNADRMRFFEIGPNVGYAYSVVIDRHFFLTGSFSVSFDYSTSRIFENDGYRNVDGFSPNTFFRVFGGYNSKVWAITANYVNNGVHLPTGGSGQLIMNTGNVRLNFVYRFQPSRKTKKYLKVIDNVG
ncbi:DUF4421 domain-containing protein [Chryseolinea lacunae]|uniref:DUF4421 domain-containing protein n=1 Tax=Chryseolinea lacunae TaxID=2801331 RepID=A0ABS1KKW5_9BACT|nr:DUF4421 domain-containing protein [Chryseolinea lacunae]MBL0740101.1 DUF4421 domain-containing protein [Chryseolinea lacunae]